MGLASIILFKVGQPPGRGLYQEADENEAGRDAKDGIECILAYIMKRKYK
jgi:hypothetical protein